MNRIGIVLCSVLLVRCGGSAINHDDQGASNNVAPTATPTPICDGSTSVRLAGSSGGGGQIEAGRGMLAENGWQYLLVDGTCHAWLLASESEPLREVTLTRDREDALSRALQLSDWSTLMGERSGGCADGPTISYRFDQLHLSGPGCGLTPGDPLEAINTAFAAQVEQLSAIATASTGDVRYLVIRDDNSLINDHRTPLPWPLSVSLESVSITRDQASQFTPGRSQRATGDDATKLRAIRSTHPATASAPAYDSTPVVGTDGVPAALYLRDAAPFESENGLMANGIF